MTKPKGRPTIESADQLSRKEQIALRDKSVEIVEEMLATGPKTSGEMALQISIPRATLNGHLRYMQQTLRIIRPTGEKKGCSTLWVLGEDPAFGSRRPANVKPYRDPLVAALFGPANQQEHKEAAWPKIAASPTNSLAIRCSGTKPHLLPLHQQQDRQGWRSSSGLSLRPMPPTLAK